MERLAISAQELRSRLCEDCDLVIVDLRGGSEFRAGHIPAAIHVPIDVLAQRVAEVVPNRDADIVTYCDEGLRSAHARQLLSQLGYSRVVHLESGFSKWRALGFPVERGAEGRLERIATDRYSRQILLGPISERGQQRLTNARVLVIGVGGLGSPAALYLAGAGVGTLGIVDSDVVDISNLHRQIIHDTPSVGTSKVDSARIKLEAVNPGVRVMAFEERFSSHNAERILAEGWNVILDGADNFPTRYALNDAALRARVPVCHGSVDRFEGRVTTFPAERGPCYRCLFPTSPTPGAVGNCAERGILGVLPGLIGVLQATEALKLILGIGKPLVGRLLTYDALEMEFRQIRYSRDPNCSTCARIGSEAKLP